MQERGIKADFVLSLDGVNDVAYRFLTLLLTLRHGESNRHCPNEVRLLDRLAQYRSYPDADAGPLRDLFATGSSKVADLKLIQPPPELEDGIVGAFSGTLAAFRCLCNDRGLRCLNFLQPALLSKWSVHRTAQLMDKFRDEVEQLQEQAAAAGAPFSSDSAFDTIRRRYDIRLHWGEAVVVQDDVPRSIDWTSIYTKCQKLWANRGAETFEFIDLSALFADRSGEYFLLDGIHYTLTGSREIASATARMIMAASADLGIGGGEYSADGLRTPVTNPPDTDWAFEKILARCAEHVQKHPTAAPALGWRMLEGQPPLAAGEEAAWAALAAELRELAASARARPRSFAWETIPGELYPFY
jgi:hypothetical protein